MIINISNSKAPSTSAPKKLPVLPCIDDYTHCPSYAKQGLCSKDNNSYYCRKSCNFCTPNLPCVDEKDCTKGISAFGADFCKSWTFTEESSVININK